MNSKFYNIQTLGQDFLAIMAKPIAGEWVDDEFQSLADREIRQIVSLLEISEAYELGLQHEQEFTEKYAMQFTSFPIPDRSVPSSISAYQKLVQNIAQQVQSGQNTVIHCRAGIGRSGLVAAGVLLCNGLQPEEAFQQISLKRGVQVPDTTEQRHWLIENYRTIVQSDSSK